MEASLWPRLESSTTVVLVSAAGSSARVEKPEKRSTSVRNNVAALAKCPFLFGLGLLNLNSVCSPMMWRPAER